MGIGIVGLILIQIGLALLGRLLAPRTKRGKPAPFQVPSIEAGGPVQKVYGIQQVAGQVILLKDTNITEIKDGERVSYRVRMVIALGYGPLDVLYDIIGDERSLMLQRPHYHQSIRGSEPITTIPFPIQLTGVGPVQFNIAALRMFGGDKPPNEGGWMGQVRLYRGTDNQPIDPLITYGYGEFASAYPNIAYICLGNAPNQPSTSIQGTLFYISANSPAPKPISFVVGSYPKALLGNLSPTDCIIGQDANPAEVMFDIWTNKVYGRGIGVERFNIPNWQNGARRFKAMGIGVSHTLASQELDEFIDDVKATTDCEVVANPLTGLLELQILGPTYRVEDLPILNDTNTREFRESGKTLAKTLNDVQVKFKKFLVGGVNHVEDEVVSENMDFILDIFFLYNAQGRNLTNVVAKRVRNGVEFTLINGVDYVFNAVEGSFLFGDNTNLDHGDKVTITYDAASLFSGFVDDSSSAQNSTNRQLTGNSRPEAFDFPMITTKLQADQKAQRLIKILSRDLPIYKWKNNRALAGIKVADPVFSLHANKVIRVTQVDYKGFNSRIIECQGIEDVFGESISSGAYVFGQPPEVLPAGPVAPAVVTSCLGGATRIGLFAADPSLQIELWRATDIVGTGAVLITTLSGSTNFYDDPQTIGVERFYRARLIGFGYSNGPFSTWMGCTASAGAPSVPVAIMPTWLITQTQTTDEGTAELQISDPQLRVRFVEVQSKVGNVETTFSLILVPFIKTVELLSGTISTVTFRITYLDADFEEVSDEITAIFDLSPPPGPVVTVPDAAAARVLIPLHAVSTHGTIIENVPSGITALHNYSMRQVDAGGCSRGRIHVFVTHPLPIGAVLAIQYVPATNVAPSESDWQFLDGSFGPRVPIDAISTTPFSSPYVSMALLARQDIFIRGAIMGGDGVTPFGYYEAFAELAGNVAGESPEVPGDHDPCQESTHNFGGYENTADLLADWPLFDLNLDDLEVVWSLDLTGGVGGSRALKVSIPTVWRTGSVFTSGRTYLVTGLTPGVQYELRGKIKTDWDIEAEAFEPQVGIVLTTTLGAGNVTFPPTSAAHGAFEEVITDPITVGAPGEAYISCVVSNLSHAGQKNAWFDDLTLQDIDGEIMSPCEGGPTIPGDGGFEPVGPPGPIIPPPETGMRTLTLWGLGGPGYPLTSFPPVYGTVKSHFASYAKLTSFLTAVRAADFKVLLDFVGHNAPKVNGSFSVSRYLDILNSWAGFPLDDWADVVQGIHVIDEPFCTTCWGLSEPIQYSVVDGVLGKRTWEIFPNFPTFIRVSSIALKQRGAVPRYIKASMNQWSARSGGNTGNTRDVSAFISMCNASAAALNLRQFWGINVANFGDARTTIPAAELRRVGMIMAADKASFGVYMWAGLNVSGFNPSYLQTAPYISALNDIVEVLAS